MNLVEVNRYDGKGIEIVSLTPISFREKCIRCEAPTKKSIAVQVKPHRPAPAAVGLAAAFTTAGHVVHATDILRAGSVRVPCCRACRRPYYIGNLIAAACVVASIFTALPLLNDKTPQWQMNILVPLTMLLLFGWIIPYYIGKEKAAPVEVTREIEADGRYHYFFNAKLGEVYVLKMLDDSDHRDDGSPKPKQA